MTELEKLDAGLEYDFWDEEVNARKLHAVKGCEKLNKTDQTDEKAVEAAIRELFGSAGKDPAVLPGDLPPGTAGKCPEDPEWKRKSPVP